MSSTSAAAAAAAAKARNKKKKAKGKKAANTLATAAEQQQRDGTRRGGVLLGTDDLDDDDEDEYEGELALENHAGHRTPAQQQHFAAAAAAAAAGQQQGHQHQQQPPSSTLAHPAATPSDLLSTASDLYRQIEAAAASALSSHPSFAASFPPNVSSTGQQQSGPQSAQQQQQGGTPATGNISNAASSADEAYWTSLPQHLRQFIRSALPLAAGWTSGPNGQPVPAATPGTTSTTIPLAGLVSGLAGATSTTTNTGGALPPLTHEQLSSAAAQLAQMVQSNWGQFGLGPVPPNGTVPRSATLQQQQQQQQGGNNTHQATISLGSFPVGMPTREQMEEAIGSIGGQFAGGEFTMTMGPTGAFPAPPPPPPPAAPPAAAANAEPVIDDTEDEDAGANEGGTSASAAAKKKNTKKKKKERERAAAAAAAAATAAAAAQQKEAAEAEAFRQRALDVANAEAYAAAAVAAKVPAPPGAYPSSAGAPQQHQPSQSTVNGTSQANASSGSNHHAQVNNNQHSNNTNANAKAGPSSEREQIRDFWLGLKEQDRRALVKVEKEAVLKKMKQAMSGSQGGACSCGVCGRKRCVLLPLPRILARARSSDVLTRLEQVCDRVRVIFAIRRVLRRTRVVCFASAAVRFSAARHDPAATRSWSLPRFSRPVHVAGNTSGRFYRRRWCRYRRGRETAARSSRQADAGSQERPTGGVVVASQEEASCFRR